jgi:hypothetical protein
MADRYWVGGTAAWDGTAGTKWALTSGGTGGQAVPTSADDVFFSNLSTGTCTISTGNTGAKSIDCTGFTGTITGTAAITVAGSITLVAGMTYSHTGTVTMSGTGTLTTAGKTFSGLTINGSGITVSLGDNLDISTRTLTVTTGTFTTTASNYSITAGVLSSSNANTRTISLNGSTVTLSGMFAITFTTSTNLTFNAGTSQITLSYSGPTIAGGDKTFYNVSITGTYGASITGANTFNNLTFANATSGNSAFRILLSANQTINGTFTVSASSKPNARLSIRSDTTGTPRTITAAAVSLGMLDFRDITAAGAAAPFTGTSLGNASGNSNITFTAAKTVYWNFATGGNFYADDVWATSSGGSVANANYPLPQDTATFVDTGLNTSASVSPNAVNAPAINASGRTLAMTLSIGSTAMCGNITLSSAVTVTGTGVSFVGSTTFTQNSATLNNNFTVSAGATLTLGDAIATSGALSNSGTLTLNNNQFTSSAGSITLGANATTNFGTGTISTSASSSTVFSGSATHTVTGTPVVNFTYTGATGTRIMNAASPTEANAISFNITGGTDSVNVLSSIKNLNLTGFAGTFANQAITMYGNWTNPASGITYTAGDAAITFAATSGTQTITTNSVTLDFPITKSGIGGTLQLNGALTLGVSRTLLLSGGTLDASNQNVTVGKFLTNGTSVRTLNMGSGTWTLSGTGTVWDCSSNTNFTLNPNTSNIVLSDTSVTARTFAGGGLTYNNLTIGGTTGISTLTFTGSNTFNTLSSTKTVAHTILFTASTTNTFTTFNINGTSGNVVTIGSVTASSHTLAKAGGGTVTADYLSISRSTATPTLTWLATNSTDGGNNSGWYFGAFPLPGGGNFFLLF